MIDDELDRGKIEMGAKAYNPVDVVTEGVFLRWGSVSLLSTLWTTGKNLATDQAASVAQI